MRVASNFVDITGQRFGRRVVISREPTPVYKGKKGSSMWRLLCDCGKESTVATSNVKSSTSCGCDTSYTARSGNTRKKDFRNKPAEDRAGYLGRKYGMTPEMFKDLLKSQDNCCAICKKEFIKTPCVDHDHKCCPGDKSCGKCIRALLCFSCNTGLGSFKDSVNLLTIAQSYLSYVPYTFEVI